jgi:uncharacterized protein YidB (DUF937 family)
MGLLDSLVGALAGGGSGSGNLAGSVLSMLGNGGLQNIEKAFQQGGLGEIVKSWISTGQNLPVSAQQLQQVLGPQIGQLAQQHGLSTDAVTSQLSQLLPGLVDKLTPQGQVPHAAGLEDAIGALRKLF